MDRVAAGLRAHQHGNGNNSPLAPSPGGSQPRPPVLGYRAPLDEARARPPGGVFAAACGFLAVLPPALAGLGIAEFTANRHDWLLCVGPVVLTLPPALVLHRLSPGRLWRQFCDGFLAGSLVVLVLGIAGAIALWSA